MACRALRPQSRGQPCKVQRPSGSGQSRRCSCRPPHAGHVGRPLEKSHQACGDGQYDPPHAVQHPRGSDQTHRRGRSWRASGFPIQDHSDCVPRPHPAQDPEWYRAEASQGCQACNRSQRPCERCPWWHHLLQM